MNRSNSVGMVLLNNINKKPTLNDCDLFRNAVTAIGSSRNKRNLLPINNKKIVNITNGTPIEVIPREIIFKDIELN